MTLMPALPADPVGRWKLYTETYVWTAITMTVLYDLLAARMGGEEATISRFLRDGPRAYVGFYVIIGVLIGHFWFSQGK